MYDERPYGDILREERERSGYDLNSMSRRLHIRPDILMAIEQSDFDRMPAMGYSKNMVRAYARALHLDDRAITDMFLDQAHMHDVGGNRRAGSRSGYSDRPASSRSRSYSRDLPERSSYSRGSRDRGDRYSNSRSLNMDAEPPSRSRRRSGYSREDARDRSYGRDGDYGEPNRSRPPERERTRERRGSGFSAGAFLQSIANRGNRQETKVGRSFDTIGSNPPYARNNVGGAGNTLASLNLPLLLLIVVALVILIIVVVIVTNGSTQATRDLPDIPISGLTDTSGSSSGSDSASNDDDVVSPADVQLPEAVDVVLEVADGQESWVEVYLNGSSSPKLAKVLKGPDTKIYEMNDKDKSIRIRTANPSALTVTVNDKPEEFTNEGNGNYSFTFSFSDYLQQWKKDNGVEDASSKSKKSSSSKKSTS